MLGILSNPFVIGILSFIAGALFVYIKSLFKQHALKKEIAKLKDQIVGNATANYTNIEKIKALEEQVNNQKVTIQILQTQPSRHELRELRLYTQAYTMMTKNAPGFAQAWQNCVDEITQKEAEEALGNIIFTKPLQKLISAFKRPTAAIDAEVPEASTGVLISEQSTTKSKQSPEN